MPYFFYLYWSSYSSLCSIFDAISSNIDEVLSINPFYNMLVFGDFKVHHKDWLPYSGGTDRTTLTIFLSKMILLRRLSFLLGSMTVILTVLFFCTYSSLLKLVFVLKYISIHWGILSRFLSQFPLINCQTQKVMTVLSQSLWLFLCWLGQSSWSFERSFIGGNF